MYTKPTENSENCIILDAWIVEGLQRKPYHQSFWCAITSRIAAIDMDQGLDLRDVFAGASRNIQDDVDQMTDSYTCYDEKSTHFVNNPNDRYRVDR